MIPKLYIQREERNISIQSELVLDSSLPSSFLLQRFNKNTKSDDDDDDDVYLSSDQTEPTVTQVWGPFYVQNAPFRAKISPVYAFGTPILIKGRVFGLDTRRPIPFTCIDIWHASPQAQYDYQEKDPNVKFEYKEELNTHGQSSHFDYRARLITNEHGQYEFETVKLAPYFYTEAQGYQPLVTQLYFKGEDKNNIDRHIRESTTIEYISVEYQRTDASRLLWHQ